MVRPSIACALIVPLTAFGIACREQRPTSPTPTAATQPTPMVDAATTPATADAAPVPTRAEPSAPAPRDPQARLAVNGLARDLFVRLAARPGNLVFSPASIAAALAMTAAGASGDTAREMNGALHLGEPSRPTIDALGDAVRAWDDPRRTDATLRVANRLFGERSYTFEAPYLDYVRTRFDAPLEPLDFRGAPGASRDHINAWVLDHTRQHIRDLLPPAAIDRDTRLVLVNAVYFDARWASPFERISTRPMPFRLASGAPADVPTMHARETLAHVEHAGGQVVELPYRGNALVMRLMLPPEGERPETWIARAGFDVDVPSTSRGQILLALPKFRIEPAGEPIRLRAHLEALGIHLAFQRTLADFSGIARPPRPEDRLAISEAFHKAFVRVDEEGTEAAAATAVVMMRGAGAPMPAPEIRFDRPFLFEIVDVATGAILFIGRVDDPR